MSIYETNDYEKFAQLRFPFHTDATLSELEFSSSHSESHIRKIGLIMITDPKDGEFVSVLPVSIDAKTQGFFIVFDKKTPLNRLFHSIKSFHCFLSVSFFADVMM